MANLFPAVGPADAHGIRGLYLGEMRHDLEYIASLSQCLCVLALQVDVLFLDMCDAGKVPPSRSLQAIKWALGPRAQMVPWYLPCFFRLVREAKSLGLPVRGLYVAGALPPETPPVNETARQGPLSLFHDVWRQSVVAQMREIFGPRLAGKRYAIYGRMDHGPMLKELLPEMICYALDARDLSFREYIRVAGGRDGEEDTIQWAE